MIVIMDLESEKVHFDPASSSVSPMLEVESFGKHAARFVLSAAEKHRSITYP
jgi:hypothetical protein